MLTAAIAALVLSSLFLATAITVLVLLRRGDGPRYSASRQYDANRREAIRILTGDDVPGVSGEQWYLRAARERTTAEGLARAHRDAALEALRLVAPPDRNLAMAEPGARLEGALVVPTISVNDLRASGVLDAWDGQGLFVGLTLVNAEPPGGDAARVCLPVQILFPALERAGREDLVRRFAELRGRVAASLAGPPASPADVSAPLEAR